MPVPSRAVLAGQLHCLTADSLVVITAQHWTDPVPAVERPTGWLRLVRNGRERQVLRFTGEAAQRELSRDWCRLRDRYAATTLAEEQMWAALRELTGIEQVRCSSAAKCSGRLPVAWPWCPACGRDQRKVSGGGLSGVRGRRELHLDLRKPLS